MNFRSLERDAIVTVKTPDCVAEVLVSDNPAAYDPGLLVNRVVVMPKLRIVSLLSKSMAIRSEQIVVDQLAGQLAAEAKEDCPNSDDCNVAKCSYDFADPAVGIRLFTKEIVCRANECPLGIRPEPL